MKQPKDWYDVEDILYEGTKEDVQKMVCPDCGKKIQYRYSEEVGSFEIRCIHCGYISRSTGSPKPKCVDYFGIEYNWMTSSKLEEIKNRLLEFSGLMTFKYGEMECDIDPFNPHLFHVACDGTEKDVYSIKDVMKEPLFAGHSLDEIAEEIEILDW